MMKNSKIFFFATLGLFVSSLLISCEKEITVDLPTVAPKIVVEGSIEQGQPPIVMLTWSQGYFEPTNLQTLENMYVRDALVTVSNGSITVELDQLCTADLTPEQLQIAAEAIGIPAEVLVDFNVCIYTSFNSAIFGELGKVYTLHVDKDDHHLDSETKINNLVYIDSLWFKVLSQGVNDSLGFIFGTLTDPDTTGNAYRWYAKRINKYSSWAPNGLAGQQKDFSFIAPIGSVFDDEFFNGLSFEFAYYRGSAPNSNKFDDLNSEGGYFKRGDTVAVRGCVTDRSVFNFYLSFESQVSNQGSPFALPYNVQSNVNGGLGVWAGFGAIYDTVVCN